MKSKLRRSLIPIALSIRINFGVVYPGQGWVTFHCDRRLQCTAYSTSQARHAGALELVK